LKRRDQAEQRAGQRGYEQREAEHAQVQADGLQRRKLIGRRVGQRGAQQRQAPNRKRQPAGAAEPG